jgi:hypothetical protein
LPVFHFSFLCSSVSSIGSHASSLVPIAFHCLFPGFFSDIFRKTALPPGYAGGVAFDYELAMELWRLTTMPHAYGNTQGPLGFPMTDAAAQKLDAVLRGLPKSAEFEYRHCLSARAPTELNSGERSDVSWITTESVDRGNEVVLARGMDDQQFRTNPVVTLGHNYDLPPVGRSLWRKRVRDGERVGIKAKTVYPARPEMWPVGESWLSDNVFALVQAGLLQGKSIGFLPTKVHPPEADELKRNAWPHDVRLVIDEWLLLEYACVTLPANQDALVEAVSKGAIELATPLRSALGLPEISVRPIPFLPFAEVERAVQLQIQTIDIEALTKRTVSDIVERFQGKV